jgi:septum site-determining protein MinD
LPRVIAVVSGKGGVGKTVTTANLALALQEFGENVITIDGDPAASNLALQLNIYPSDDTSLQKVLEGKIDILRAITVHPSGLMVIPSSLSLQGKNIDSKKLRKILKNLKGIVLIDSPPGVNKDVLSIIEASDEILIVTNPEIPAVADVIKLVQVIKSLGREKDILGIVVNKAEGWKYEVKDSEIEIATEVPIICKIPHDKETKKSIFMRTPIVKLNPYSKVSIEYKKLAAWLIGKYYEAPKLARIRALLRRLI